MTTCRTKGVNGSAVGGERKTICDVAAWLKRVLAVWLVSPLAAVATNGSPPPFHLLRYEEDYSYLARKDAATPTLWENLKYIPFAGQSIDAAYLSIGGEIRFQYIEKWDDQFGRVPGSQGSLQQRYLLHTDMVWPKHFRVFGQMISAREHGRKPSALPVDQDHLDAQQVFVEASLNPQHPHDDYIRVGRQEILLGGHELLKIREGPNVRLAFDGARLHLAEGNFDADIFATNVVQPKVGSFDNSWFDDSVAFDGFNVGWKPKWAGFSNLRADAFVFDYLNRFVRYEQASGREHRQTYGARLSGRNGPWEFDYEGSVQEGTLQALDIHAWGVALFTSYHFDAQPAQPKLTFSASRVTGDRDRNDRQLNTFNCLFARGDYFGDTSLLTGSNTLDLGLTAECSPCTRFHASIQWDKLWRSETSDGLYAPPLVYIRDGRVSDARFIGDQFTLTATYVVNRFLTLQALAAQFVAGNFIKAGPTGKDTEGLTFRTQFKF